MVISGSERNFCNDILVIFDCDGVLVDSETIAANVFAQRLQDFDLLVSAEECMIRFKGRSMQSCLRELSTLMGPGQVIPNDFLVSLQAETFARFNQELQPVAGVEFAIMELHRRGVRTCVASSGSYDKMGITLGKTGLVHLFEGRIFSAVDVAHGKPAPDIFLHAAENMGFEPSACLVVEDSLPGIQAAQAAGMFVLAYGDDPLVLALQRTATNQVIFFDDMLILPDLLTSLVGHDPQIND